MDKKYQEDEKEEKSSTDSSDLVHNLLGNNNHQNNESITENLSSKNSTDYRGEQIFDINSEGNEEARLPLITVVELQYDAPQSIDSDITNDSNNNHDMSDRSSDASKEDKSLIHYDINSELSDDNHHLKLGNNSSIENKKTYGNYTRNSTLPLLIAQNKMLIAAIFAVIVGVAAALIGFGIIPGGAGYLTFLSATGIPSYFVGIAGTTIAGSAVLGVAYKASFFNKASVKEEGNTIGLENKA